MASTFVVSRSQLIYALCLPLAVLIGYFLAEPLESGSIAIVVFVMSVLCLPLPGNMAFAAPLATNHGQC